MGNAHATNRLQIAPYTNTSQQRLTIDEGFTTPYYATYQAIRQMTPSSYQHHHQQQQQQQPPTNEALYIRNQPPPQIPSMPHSHPHLQLSQLPQLPLLHRQISNNPMEQQQQYQQQQQQHYHQQQNSYIQTVQKGSNLNYAKNNRKNPDKHLDALVGLVLPTKNNICNSISNNNNQLYTNSNENTLRRTKNVYSPKFQTNGHKHLPEIMLEKNSSSEYFFSNRDKSKQTRKKMLTCRSQETGKNVDELNKESKSESHLTTNFEYIKTNPKSSRFENYTVRAKFNQPATNVRKSRSQHKINKRPSFNSKISIKQRQEQQALIRKETTTNDQNSTYTDEEESSESNYESINKIENEQQQRRPRLECKVEHGHGDDVGFKSFGVQLQTHPPPPPPPPPLSCDTFKHSDPNLFDHLKKNKKLPSIIGQFDEKTSKSFDAVVNELKTKLNRIQNIETKALASGHQTSGNKKEAKSAFSSVVSNEVASTKTKKHQSNYNKNKQSSSVIHDFYHNNIIKKNNNELNKVQHFKPVINNETLTRKIDCDSFKLAKAQNINKKPNNSLNGSTTNTEQTTSNPNIDLTQMSSSSLSSHLNRSHKIAEHDNNNNHNNELIPPAISSSVKVTDDATYNLENLKHSIPVSSSSYIEKMPKEISTSSTKIVNSVANSFKLEIFDNANSDDDSDDYTKYNRVKFSPTTAVTEPVTESETNGSPVSMKISSSNTNASSSSKSISFSFKNKSNELLKKIQKRNTFASLAKPALASCVDKDRELCEEPNSDKCKGIVEAKLYKSKSAHVKKVSLEKSLTLKSINIDEEKTSTSVQSHINRKSNINFIKVSPRVKSIAAFSTRNLFRNFETSSPNEKVSSPISELNLMTTNNTSTNNNLLTPIENKTTDSMKIQNFKAKIYDNLMKSITNASIANSLLKTEYKPRVVTSNINNDEIKTISLKSSGLTCGLNKSETCKEIIKSKLISLSNEIKRENSQPPIISDSNILNSKSVGQIPSKYSSFTDYNKNKISNKLNEILATNNKSFISTTIPRDWKIMSNNCDFYDEEFYDYDSFSHMQPYEYAPKYLSFNYITNSSDANENSTKTLEQKANNANVTDMKQERDSKSQRLNDYLVEMTNYYRNFNNKISAATNLNVASGGENNLKV